MSCVFPLVRTKLNLQLIYCINCFTEKYILNNVVFPITRVRDRLQETLNIKAEDKKEGENIKEQVVSSFAKMFIIDLITVTCAVCAEHQEILS